MDPIPLPSIPCGKFRHDGFADCCHRLRLHDCPQADVERRRVVKFETKDLGKISKHYWSSELINYSKGYTRTSMEPAAVKGRL